MASVQDVPKTLKETETTEKDVKTRIRGKTGIEVTASEAELQEAKNAAAAVTVIVERSKEVVIEKREEKEKAREVIIEDPTTAAEDEKLKHN
ncbi:hypothetical protein LR48_Vigan10g157700 [Vigna angularis]|uniref:Uncharacterized protein n=2 Tax=Phaseolus angularis TaxID=3914 RepID=A0A0L9VKV6_PHAAN|nr:uncharacterized protein HKW66_Vig0073420 [Vigna angularis]KOM55685.1 hypothetical protein LR48_Vigan10g157700 [Vigna angularis]BAT87917.1 hypothetical protein VIGAN_05133900 [Vigna angularis var. angularis]